MFLGRVVGPTDPLWLPADRESALAWRRDEADHCPVCRTRRSTWRAAGPGELPYIGQLHACPGCELLDEEKKNIPQGKAGHVTAYLAPAALVTDPSADLAEAGVR